MRSGDKKKCGIKDNVFLRLATLDDIAAIEPLLNRCYRNDEGWTNEAALVSGVRTTRAELTKVIEDANQYLFVYPQTEDGLREGKETDEMLACIGVAGKAKSSIASEQIPDSLIAHIGMFAVHPERQGQGVGDVLLRAAESFATRHYSQEGSPCRLTMSILNHRPELLAYYQRRGYQLTGKSMPFPNDGNNGEPLREDLRLLELEKVSG